MYAKNLREIRVKKKVTQRELSERSGVTINTISGAERGLNISEDTVAILAKALGVSVKKLTV